MTFDPDGGPYMEVGKYTIDGKTLTRVFTRDGITYFQVNNWNGALQIQKHKPLSFR